MKNALFWLEKIPGNSTALHICGTIYLYGFDGQKPDLEKALTYFKQAAQHNNIKSMEMAASILNTLKRIEECLEYTRRAAQAGSTSSMLELSTSLLNLNVKGQKIDKGEVRLWLKKAADGDLFTPKICKHKLSALAEQLNQSALFLYDSTDNPINKKYALKYALKAAEYGHAESMSLVAHLYDEGFLDQNPDPILARKYDIDALKTGTVTDFCAIGSRFLNGYGDKDSINEEIAL